MNFMGIGALELFAILVVALIFLGPNRMVDAARTLGKTLQEFRRTTSELTQFGLGEEPERPIVHRPGGPQTTNANKSEPGDSVQAVPYKGSSPPPKEEEGSSPEEGSDTP